jgi:hypothetical protein
MLRPVGVSGLYVLMAKYINFDWLNWPTVCKPGF